jgi:hypothetical protein
MGIFKEKPYVDYTKSSKYFNSDYKKLQDQEEDQEVNNAKKFVSWVQSFSKKIIVAVAIMYFAIVLFTLVIIAIQTFMGSTPTLDSIFTEVNTTFRIVVAGYLVKAGVENSFKIAGNYKVGLKDAELQANRELFEYEATINEDCPVEDDVDLNESEDTTI